MPRVGLGGGWCSVPIRRDGAHGCIALVAGLPRAFLAFRGTLQLGLSTGRGWCHPRSVLGTPACALQSPETVPRVPEGAALLAAPFSLAGCVWCLPGHRSSRVQLTALECPHPARASCQCCSLSSSPPLAFAEGADGWKPCCFSPSCLGRAWHWQWGQERQSCCPAVYSAFSSRIESKSSGSFLARQASAAPGHRSGAIS